MKNNNKKVIAKKYTKLSALFALIFCSLIYLVNKPKLSINTDDIIKLIEESDNLTDDEKAFLINEEFFNDLTYYISTSGLENRTIDALTDIDIVPYTAEELKLRNDRGYYDKNISNDIHVRNYNEEVTDQVKDTVSHEFIHKFQPHNRYHYISEPATVITNEEYYNVDDESYKSCVKRLKVLMEIIGPLPVWDYVYTGDSGMMEKVFRDNLDENVFNELLQLLRTEPMLLGDESINNRIDEIFRILYFNIYYKDINDNKIINAIYDDMVISRRYFNVTENEDIIASVIPFDEAIINNEIGKKVSYKQVTYLSDEKYAEMMKKGLGNNQEISISYVSDYNYSFTYNNGISDGYVLIETDGELNNYLINEAIELGYLTRKISLIEEKSIYDSDMLNKLLENGVELNYSWNNELYSLDMRDGKLVVLCKEYVPNIFQIFKEQEITNEKIYLKRNPIFN